MRIHQIRQIMPSLKPVQEAVSMLLEIPGKQTETLIIICYKTNIGAKLQNE